MCKVCDNPEGNLCQACENEQAEIKAQALYDDGWWPAMAVGQRTINIASGEDCYATL